MDLPVIHLNKFNKKTEQAVAETSSAIPLGDNSTEIVLASGINFLFLAGLFCLVFGSTMFFVQNTGSGVFAKANPGKYLASVAGVLDTQPATTTDEVLPVQVILYKDPFEGMAVEGKAAYVFDVASGKALYEKNKGIQMPLASITKIMTALVAMDILDSNDIVTVEEGDLVGEGGPTFAVGERWRVKDLLDFTLVSSSNDGAGVLARAAGRAYAKRLSGNTESSKEVFVEKMNEKAQAIGMIGSTFHNESGLDISGSKSGGYATAADIATLYQFILANKPGLLEATRQARSSVTSEDNIVHTAKNTNLDAGSIPGLVASKTGTTDLAGGNLSVVFDSGLNTPIIVVVLGSSIDGRFSDVERLSRAAREAVGQGIY